MDSKDNILDFVSRVTAHCELSKKLTAKADARAKLLDDGTEVGALQSNLVRLLDLRRRSKLYADLLCDADEHVHEGIERMKAQVCDSEIADITAKLDENFKARRADAIEDDTSKDSN